MKIGYARVSTQDQDLSLQIDALHQAGCDQIYQEKFTGSTKNALNFRSCWTIFGLAMLWSSGN
jgi:DNA invertase Pin-like site-specific DNA recombinase